MTASPIEVLQFVAAGVGAGFNLWGLVGAYRDRRWLRMGGFNGPREYWADTRIQQECLLLVSQFVLVTIGLVSVNIKPAVGEFGLDQGSITRIGLVVVTLLLATFSIKTRMARQRLDDWPTGDRKQK